MDETTPKKRTWIPRETWRQEQAVIFAREAITVSHIFMAHDRSRDHSGKEHYFQKKRGVIAGVPDTQLIIDDLPNVWFELKAPGKSVEPGDDQDKMLLKLRALGSFASWGVTIADLCRFWRECGVPLAQNADYIALHMDGLVDSRIARAERGDKKAFGGFRAVKKPTQRQKDFGMKMLGLAVARPKGR